MKPRFWTPTAAEPRLGQGIAGGVPAITSLVASVFVDEVADHVEREHYPAERPGVALPLGVLPIGFAFGLAVAGGEPVAATPGIGRR